MFAATPPSPPVQPGYAETRRLDLQAAFHTKAPWSVYALTPTGADAETGDKPVRICFEATPSAEPTCTAITSGLDNDKTVYAYQTLETLRVEPLSPARKGVVAKAIFSGGGSGALTQTVVWTFTGGKIESFSPTATFKITNLGEDRRFTAGPLAGCYVTADFVWGPGETHWDKHRFIMDAYKLTKSGGYLLVLSYVTHIKYPAERQATDYVINHELPHLRQLLGVVYPKGPPA